MGKFERTDIHRPSAIVPADYEFVANDYWGPGLLDLDMVHERRTFREHMKRTGGTHTDHEHGGTCGLCGANALYVAKFYHAKSNQYLTTGQDCALKLQLGDKTNFSNFRKHVAARRKAAAERSRLFAVLKDKGLEAAWNIYAAEDRSAFESEEHTVYDIVSKGVKYDLSERQLNFLHVLLRKIADRAAIKAKRAAEQEAAKPVPVEDGRIEFAGDVISVKEVEGRFGRQTKILVKADDGFRLWGTCPAALMPVERGTHVKLRAHVTPSKDDPKFGFFDRPTVVTE